VPFFVEEGNESPGTPMPAQIPTELRSRALAALIMGVVMLTATACDRRSASDGDLLGDFTLVTVSAHAEARRPPDIATLSTGVVSLAPDANGAIRRNSERMAKVVESIKAAGIASTDVQTSGVTLNPDYHYLPNRPPRIKGYYASNTVNVTVRDIGRIGKILDALVATGANQINGPTFDIEDREPALDEARRKALDKAQARARMYAKSLGMRVRRIVSISEGGRIDVPMPMVRMEKMAASDAGTSVSPGENVLSMNLDVVFEIGN